MKKIIFILFIVVLLIGGFFWWQQGEVTIDDTIPKNSAQLNNKVYTIEEADVKFAIPAGWYAKPYPVDNKIVFLSPKDFQFPEAWGGPLTPIIITVHKDRLINYEVHKTFIKEEPHLEVENLEFKGYQAIRVKGVPKVTSYLEGRYYEGISIQRGVDVIEINYYGGGPELPEYLEKYHSIIESLEI